jgi:RNA polymerase sigma factor (sigma-70 family)
MINDKEIWNNFRKGEDSALSTIYFQNVQILYHYGKKFIEDDDFIKDVIQDLFFDLIRSRENLGETDNIRYYLLTSFRRRLFKCNYKKKKNNNITIESLIEKDFLNSAEDEIIFRETQDKRNKTIKDAMSKLKPRQQEILFYRFSCNYEYEFICEKMNLQYDSARKQVSRALKSLKKIISGLNTDEF